MTSEPLQKPHTVWEIARHIGRRPSVERGWKVLPVMAFPVNEKGSVSTSGRLMHLAESPEGNASVLFPKRRRLVSSELKSDAVGAFATVDLKDWKGEPGKYLLQAPYRPPEQPSDLAGRRAALAGLTRPQAYEGAFKEAVKAIEDGELSESSAFELIGRRMKQYTDAIVEIKGAPVGIPGIRRKNKPKK